MNAFTRHLFATVLVAAGVLAVSERPAAAQTIGTFPFGLNPFCNTVQLTVTLDGGTYRLSGWDDACGATVRHPVYGTIAPNADGTLNISFSAVRPTGFGVETSISAFNLGNYQGAWTDSAGNAGTAVIVGLSGGVGGGGARPGPTSSVPANSITTINIVDGAVDAVDVNSGQVQLRVSGTCAAGQFVRSVNQDGTVVCGGGPVTLYSETFPVVGTLDSTCRNVATLSFGTVAAGTVTCDGVLHVNLNHTASTVDRVVTGVELTPAGPLVCDVLNQSEYEIPGGIATEIGVSAAVPVKRQHAVSAGALSVYLVAQMPSGADTFDFVRGHNLSCTFTPQ